MDFGHSPPIATRAGWMAIAILPFQVIFASKWNFVTVLTGVSHEKLQVYHRWSGWIMCNSILGIIETSVIELTRELGTWLSSTDVLALVHTFPFIIVDIKGGIMQETWRTDWYTVSGVMCLVPQTGLVLLSIASIRNRFYETFKL